jgi:hypothetical protein
MASVSRALLRIKQDLDAHLSPESIEAACRDAGHVWRDRKLAPVQTVHLMVLQVLHFNAAIRALRHIAKVTVSAAAYCEARARLPLAAVQALLRAGAASLRDCLSPGGGPADPTVWRGHRTLLLDGSGTLAPDTPDNRRAFPLNRRQRPGCSLPVPRVLGLFDALTGLIVELLPFDLFAHEQAKAPLLHPLLDEGDLLVGDRAFCSYAHLAILWARGVLACFRMHQAQQVDFRPHRKHYDRRGGGKALKAQAGRPRSKWVRRLGKHDQVVRWTRPKMKERSRWMTPEQFLALPEELEVREVRYRVAEKGCRTREVTVVTTLLDPLKYPKESIAELYGIRWRVETHFRELKTTLKMDRLKCHGAAGVQKELAAYCLAYNLVRAVIARAAAAQGTTPDRVSFVDALRWLVWAEADEQLPALVINPERPGRYEPRVLKRVTRTFTKMNKPRHQYKPTQRKIYTRSVK